MKVNDPAGKMFEYIKKQLKKWVGDGFEVFADDELQYKFYINGEETEHFDDDFRVQFELNKAYPNRGESYDMNFEMVITHPEGSDVDFVFSARISELNDFDAFKLGYLEIEIYSTLDTVEDVYDTFTIEKVKKLYNGWFPNIDAEFF